MTTRHQLEAGAARATFSDLGAECRSWQIGARDLLWPGDPAIWDAVAPILFPVCGWSAGGRIRVGDTHYDMPVHGFASASRFESERRSASEIAFRLRDDARTRAAYPFPFKLEIVYALSEDALSVRIETTNTGDAPMPYACGIHPGFVWGAGAHRLVFEYEERPEVPVIAEGGLFSARRRPVPLSGRRLDLTPGLFAEEALCFLDTASRSVDLIAPDGALAIEAPDFPHLTLWTRPPAPFLCVESWTGTGDLEGFRGDFHERPSMIRLAPGETRAHRVRWRWRALGSGHANP